MDVLPYKLQSNRTVEHEHTMHYRRLKAQKSVLDTKAPESFLSKRATFRGVRACWEVEHNRLSIAAENEKLMETMTRIMSSPAVQEKPVVIKSRNETGHKIELNRITVENRKLADRLENMRPLTPSLMVKQLEEHSRKSRQYAKNAAKMGKRAISPLNLRTVPKCSTLDSNQSWRLDGKLEGIRDERRDIKTPTRSPTRYRSASSAHVRQHTHSMPPSPMTYEGNTPDAWSGYTTGEENELGIRVERTLEEDLLYGKAVKGRGPDSREGRRGEFSPLASFRVKVISPFRARPASSKTREKITMPYSPSVMSKSDTFQLFHTGPK